jgi:Type II restriction endonuclease EcoO109I
MARKKKSPDSKKLAKIVSEALDKFRQRRLDSFEKLDLKNLLQRKNPYLFRAIGVDNPRKLIGALLAAYLSSSDEGIFGDAFFETVALRISGRKKSMTNSVDFELYAGQAVRAYAVKSGPKAFNAGSRRDQVSAFDECRQRLPGLAFEPVVGYGYGRRLSPPTRKKRFREVSGQAFWEEISDDPDLYRRIFLPLAEKADQHRDAYREAHKRAIIKFVREFRQEFGTADGQTDWDKVLILNSGKLAGKKRGDTQGKKKSKR